MTTRQRKPVSKALQALYWLVEMSQPEIGVRQLAAAMNIAPSSAHRVLATLADAGFVSRDIKSQRYALTPEFFRLSHRAVTMSPVRQIGLTALQRLAAVCRKSVLLGLYDDIRQEMIFVARIDSASASSHAIPMNEWLPIRTGASGLAILAFLDGHPALCDRAVRSPRAVGARLRRTVTSRIRSRRCAPSGLCLHALPTCARRHRLGSTDLQSPWSSDRRRMRHDAGAT